MWRPSSTAASCLCGALSLSVFLLLIIEFSDKLSTRTGNVGRGGFFKLGARDQHHDQTPVQPIWGCEEEALPHGDFHVLVSSVTPYGSYMHWLPHIGLTNAHVFIYYRVHPAFSGKKQASFPKVDLPCGMELFFKLLLPNRGRESAVFFSHVLEFYSKLPRAIALLHEHGPLSTHSLCGPAYRRLRGYYRELHHAERESQDRVTSQVVTLNSGCNAITGMWHLGWMPPDNCCMTMFCSHTPDCPFRDLPACLPRQLAHYDPRQQNVALIRGRHSDFVLLQYPKGEAGAVEGWGPVPADVDPSQPQEQGYEKFKELLSRTGQSVDVTIAPGKAFWSCCAQFIAPGFQLLGRSKAFYEEALSLVLDPNHGKDMAKALEWTVFEVLYPDVSSYRHLDWYEAVDKGFPDIVGCPLLSSEEVPDSYIQKLR